MTGQGQGDGVLRQLNYPGLVAGIALVVLPFLGAWWTFSFGTDAVVIAISPFTVLVESFGNEVSSPLLASLNLGLKIVMVYYGILLIAGSVLRVRAERRSISDILVKVSARKFLWLVVLFVASVAVTDFAINEAFSLMEIPAKVPYFTGNTPVFLQVGPVSVMVPVIQGFTTMFWVAVVVAVISLAAYTYQGHAILEKTGQAPPAAGEQASPGPGEPGR